MISHSLPDLSRSVSQELLLPHDSKKVREWLWWGVVAQVGKGKDSYRER